MTDYLEGTVSKRRATLILLFGLLLATLATPGLARALGEDCLVDDASMIYISPEDQAEADAEEAKFQQWLAQQRAEAAAAAQNQKGLDICVQVIGIGTYSLCGTTSHKQARNDYCGPATCTIIDHYLRGAKHWTQREWAAYKYNGQPLWTDAYGASMSVMAKGPRAKTGRGFQYTAGNSQSGVYDRTAYSLEEYHRCVAYGMKIDADKMRHYVYDHEGHIVAGRGYDYRNADPNKHSIFLDDSYPEKEYQAGDGDTYGRKTYSKEQIAKAVVASANQQMVY